MKKAMPASRDDRGFSLVEIAIVLLIVTLLAGGALTMFKAQTSYSRTAEAREQLREAQAALANYAVANQKLPCPARDANGLIDVTCPEKGYLPWSNLGIPARDPWGQTLRYAVTPAFVQTGFSLETKGALKVMEIDATGKATNIDKDNAIAFAIWSTGDDAADGSANSTGTPATIDDSTVIAQAPGVDDLVAWESRYLLFGKMLSAGRSLAVTSSSSSSSSSGGL